MMGSYHHKLLFSSVQRIPFEDHGPPLLGEMVYFCRQAQVSQLWPYGVPAHRDQN